MEFNEELPNAGGYSIAIDERGIIVEGNVDPLYRCDNIAEMVYIWHMNRKEIDSYFIGKFYDELSNL